MKKFLLTILERDKKFINELSVRGKKLLIYYIILYINFLIFFFYMEVIKIEKVMFYLNFYLIYLIYKILMELFIYLINKNKELTLLMWKYNEKTNKLLKILLFIQKWKNPFLLLLLYIDKFFLKFMRNIIYYLINYKFFHNMTKEKAKYIFFIQYLILNIITGPVKIVFGFFYSLLIKIREIPFSTFFIIRSINFFLSILIISDLLNYLYNYYGYINMYIFIYILLICISMIARFIDIDIDIDIDIAGDRHLHFEIFNKVASFISIEHTIMTRCWGTFYGILIILILTCRSKTNNLLEKKYINVLSVCYKEYLEEGFYKYWEYYKIKNCLLNFNIWNEIKNRPSLYLYYNLLYWSHVGAFNTQNGPNFITHILYLKYKGEKLNLKFPEDIQRDLDYFYNVDSLRFKLLLFMIWDIDDYIGNNNKNSITFNLSENLSIFYLGYNKEDTVSDSTFIEGIKKNKKDLKFYDIELNMQFFDRFYLILGIAPYDAPYNEFYEIFSPPKTVVHSNILRNYDSIIDNMLNRLNKFYQDSKEKEYTWLREDESADKDENDISLIEYKIRDWIIIFLEEQRKEWELLQNKESIEERNWRLLNEIENILR